MPNSPHFGEEIKSLIERMKPAYSDLYRSFCKNRRKIESTWQEPPKSVPGQKREPLCEVQVDGARYEIVLAKMNDNVKSPLAMRYFPPEQEEEGARVLIDYTLPVKKREKLLLSLLAEAEVIRRFPSTQSIHARFAGRYLAGLEKSIPKRVDDLRK